MFCIHCGHSLPDNANFCYNCGVKVELAIKQNSVEDHRFLNQITDRIPFIYDQIISEGDDYPYFKTQINNKVGLVDCKGKTIIPCYYDNICNFYTNNKEFAYSIVSRNSKYGIFRDGREFLKCEYDVIDKVDPLCYILKHDGRYGLLYERVWEYTECKFDSICKIENDMFQTSINGYIGLLKGNIEIIPCEYDEINIAPYVINVMKQHYTNEGIKSMYGMYSKQGNCILPCEYDSIINREADLFEFTKGNKIGLCSSCSILFPCNYDDIQKFESHITSAYIVKYNGRVSIMKSSSQYVIMPDRYQHQFEDICELEHENYFHCGEHDTKTLYKCLKNGKWGIITQTTYHDYEGNFRNDYSIDIDIVYDRIEIRSKLLACFKHGEYGYDMYLFKLPQSLHTQIRLVRSAICPGEVDDFSLEDDWIIYKDDGKYGLTSFEQRDLLPCQYDYIENIQGSLIVRNCQLCGLYSKRASKILGFHDDISIIGKRHIAKKNNKYGFYRHYRENEYCCNEYPYDDVKLLCTFGLRDVPVFLLRIGLYWGICIDNDWVIYKCQWNSITFHSNPDRIEFVGDSLSCHQNINDLSSNFSRIRHRQCIDNKSNEQRVLDIIDDYYTGLGEFEAEARD